MRLGYLRRWAPVAFRGAISSKPPGLPATLLLFGFNGPGVGYVYDTATGAGHRPRLPWAGIHPGMRPYFGNPVRAGDRVVLANPADRLFSLPLDLGSGPKFRLPGGGGGYFPSLNDRDLWVIGGGSHGRQRVIERDPKTGVPVRGPVEVAPTWNVVGEVSTGLLAVRTTHNEARSTIAVLSRHSGRPRVVITRHAQGYDPVIDARANVIAWNGESQCAACEIHLTDLTAGATRPLQWTPGQRFVCSEGSLSPDRRWLAVAFGCPRPDAYGLSPILLINTFTGHAQLVPGASNLFDPQPVWSKDSHWLIWDSGTDQHAQMRAYHPGSQRPYAFNVPNRIGTLLEALSAQASS